MVDGGPERLARARALPDAPREDGEIGRWLGLADRVASTFTATFALLRTSDAERLAAWRSALAGHAPGARRGGAVALDSVEGSRTTTDLALRLAVLSPTSDGDLALAAQHRPALFFDSDEPYPTPLNVDRLVASGKLRLCEQGQSVGAVCTAVDDPGDLRNGATHLRFDPDEIAGLSDGSTIYTHVTRSGNDHPNSIYIDYWWYFPHNPAGAGGGALCGAGFVIAGITCFDHQSDWEGVTVVLNADSPDTPTAVAYAQHGGVTRYSWRALEQLWDDGDRVNFGRGVDTGARPLVFVARGTHASYPTSCDDERCDVGDLPGSRAEHPTRENRHDGGERWPRDERADCPSICVAALPVRGRGQELGLWNAFDGGWGTTDCVLEFVCASSAPPRSPGFQGRYRHPWCATEVVGWTGERFTRAHPSCTGRRPSAAELTGNERLLALGDSFSSGQGAGSYDPGTNGGGNTCFRSPDAWPQQLARRLDLVALPSLACSGAVSRDVRFGTPGGERERRLSQIGRIAGDPGIVTLTIGGNDVGFAGVLKDCLLIDCVSKYRRPSGDVLEARIANLADRLPALYSEIRAAAPRARVVVLGYPRLFPDRERWAQAGGCLMRERISGAEVDYLNALTPALNAAIAGAAQQAGVDFVDVTEAFAGHELQCKGETARSSYLQPLQDAITLIPASFHPNAAGHARLAAVAAAALASP
jgi:lysophospholipase L1-like esterase